MTISARPNNNGNSKQDFFKAYAAIRKAQSAITEAQELLSANVLHGRNYQHMNIAEHREQGAGPETFRMVQTSEQAVRFATAIEALGQIAGDLSEAL